MHKTLRDDDELREFGLRLQEFIKRRGMTQNDLRKRLELKSSSAISAMIKGDVQASYTQLIRLLGIGMTVDEIFGKERVERSEEIRKLTDRLDKLQMR